MKIRKRQSCLFVSFALLVLNLSVLQTAAVLPGSLTLAWDPSSNPTVVGYRLYDGIASENYANMVDVGSNLTATMFGLVGGTTYYFAVTAYDSAGLESAFSAQISYTVPTSAPRSPIPASLFISQNDSNETVLSGTGPAGYVYDVCGSMDLSSWLTIGTATVDPSGALQFIDGASVALPWRFYRLKQRTP